MELWVWTVCQAGRECGMWYYSYDVEYPGPYKTQAQMFATFFLKDSKLCLWTRKMKIKNKSVTGSQIKTTKYGYSA